MIMVWNMELAATEEDEFPELAEVDTWLEEITEVET